MIGLFAWYIYALLALMLVGAGVGSIIRGNTLAGGGYVVGGLLLFGVAVISGRRNKTSGSNVFETNMETLLPVLKALIAEGKNTDAIRRYRVLTGSDLSEAKNLVDRLATEQAELMEGMDHHLKRLNYPKITNLK